MWIVRIALDRPYTFIVLALLVLLLSPVVILRTPTDACIHTASDSHLLRGTLAHLEEKLTPHHFIRVGKSVIVNGARIGEIRPMFDGVYDIVLAEGTVVRSSRRYAHKLRALLES